MLNKNLNSIYFQTTAWPLDVNKPTVVFIHGAGATHYLWNKQLSKLQQTINAIAIDLPGHGQSTDNSVASVARYAKKIQRFLAELNTDNIILCGHSMGGAIVMQIMLEPLSTIKAGVICNSGAKLKVLPFIIQTVQQNYSIFIDTFGQLAIAKENQTHDIMTQLKNATESKALTTLDDFTACNTFDLMATINQINLPMLVITSEHDTVTPPKYGEYLARQISSAELKQIPLCGHYSPIEKPTELNQIILNFVQRISH